MKFRMDKVLQFWVDVAAEHIKPDHANLAKRMRCLDKHGKIVWKASPRFLTMLADAERDARDDLANFP